MRIEFKDLRAVKVSSGGDAYHDVSHTAWHITAAPALDVLYVQWGSPNTSGADWYLDGRRAPDLAGLLGHEVLVSGAPEGTDAGTYDDGSVDLDDLIDEVIEDIEYPEWDHRDVMVTSPRTEPEYRLVPDTKEPITLALAASTPREPRRFEQDPLAANMTAACDAAMAVLAGADDGRGDAERVQDLLTDMFHLCDLLGLDMDDLVNTAQRHYDAEVRGVV